MRVTIPEGESEITILPDVVQMRQVKQAEPTNRGAGANARYIIVANILKPGDDNRNCRILQLASGNENADAPIYHAPRRGRAGGRYTAEEARSAIQALLGRDEVSGAIMRGRHAVDVKNAGL